MAHTVTLNWTASPDVPADSYDVYRGTAAGQETTLVNTTPITGTSFVDTPGAGVWFYIVKSVNGGGLQSVPSNEISVTVPLQPPSGLTGAVN